ncbi:hypothetical protein MMC27_007690 [Xylographa pallens]|nr:hypothetical protein [Xylographa pallens]
MFLKQVIYTSGKLLRPNELPSLYVASINSRASPDIPNAWRRAVESVAAHLDSDKVYVSVYQYADESGHRNELEQLRRNLELLGVQHSIVYANDENIKALNHTWTAQGLPVPTPATTYVHHMADMRNRVLRPMIELALQGIRFDRILFLENDSFSWQDVLELLSTRHGAFGAACALDLDASGSLCETIALRDAEGHGPLIWNFPYFRSKTSRDAAIVEEAIPVLSCWSGLVAFDAQPFYRNVVFRSIPDSLAEFNFRASERCLIHADNPYDSTEDRLGRSNPNTGVWVNPNVHVGCSSTLVPHTHTSLYGKIVGIWKNRLWRWCNSTIYTTWTAKRRLRSWEMKHPGLDEPGSYCLMNRA